MFFKDLILVLNFYEFYITLREVYLFPEIVCGGDYCYD